MHGELIKNNFPLTKYRLSLLSTCPALLRVSIISIFRTIKIFIFHLQIFVIYQIVKSDKFLDLNGLDGSSQICSYHHATVLQFSHQFVAVNEEVSYRSQVQYEVPQGSVLGPLLITLYMLPLGNINRKYGVSFHRYADDTQLYISSRPGETHQIEKLMECIVDIKTG